jgi:dTDP-4-dehydrorhamnose reductase
MSRPAARQAAAVLIGADGMLGRAMAAELPVLGWKCIAPTREQLDLSHPETIAHFIDRCRDQYFQPPNFIINCAAWTDVDGAEQHEDEATAINGHAIGELVSHCRSDMALLTFSTDYIFDGRASTPYTTDHPRAPLNAYGRSKAAGEAALEEHPRHEWLNIRTSWLYAPWGNNFVLTMRRLLLERRELRVVDDQRGRPTSAQHLARASLALLDRGIRGHHHITDGGECTWYEFACEIRRLMSAGAAGISPEVLAAIIPCTSAEFPRPARRPVYSVLDLSKTEQLLGPMPHWKDNLADVIPQLPP